VRKEHPKLKLKNSAKKSGKYFPRKKSGFQSNGFDPFRVVFADCSMLFFRRNVSMDVDPSTL
jgi:hypothetical protein